MKDEKGGQMKNDLDFDELHMAVNKLMDQAQKSKTKREPAKSVSKAVTRPSVKVAERPADKKPQPEKEEPKPAPKEEDSKIEVRRAPRVTVAPKRRGMAMDVVQAAKTPAVAPPSARAARTAPTLQPTGPVKPEPPSPRAPSPMPVAPAALPTAVDDVDEDVLTSINMQDDGAAHPQTVVSAPEPKPESAFPDPLDVHGFNDQKEALKPEVHEPSSENNMPDPLTQPGQTMEHGATSIVSPLQKEEVPAPEAPAEPAPAPSLAPAADSTPFVNAKVEKRPLGAFASTAPAPLPQPPKSEPATPAPEVEPVHNPEAAQVEVLSAPEELSPEVVAVESAEAELSPTMAAQSGESLQNLRQMSIPPQYHTTDKEPSHDDRPVFDTKTYHTPLQPVATPKRATGSKAGIILTLFLILLLVAAGVAAYFVATGSIDLSKLL